MLSKHGKDDNAGSRKGQQITHGGLVLEGKRQNQRTTIRREGHHIVGGLAGTQALYTHGYPGTTLLAEVSWGQGPPG